MNLLIDGLPDTVEIAGEQVRIETGFRTGILFEELILDEGMDDVEKLRTVLELYYPDYDFAPEVVPEAVNAAMWFYRCGEEITQGNGSGSAEDPSFSYEYDADYIYAAFLSSYGVDLARATLHWWQFRALFRALPEDTQFMKIIGYRSMKIPNNLTKDQKRHYQKMKELYRLPLSAERQKLESDLTEVLMNGGDISTMI